MDGQHREVVVVEAGPAQVRGAEVEAQRLHEVQLGPGDRGEADRVAGVARDLGGVEEDAEHDRQSTDAGRTPNPCLRCNEKIKFAALLEKALALGFDAVCTGHYAKVVEDPAGGRELHRAADWAKDQSYVLGVLTAEQLEHVLLPLADTPSKAEVRAEAARRGLSVASKPDSHDICFIPDGDTRGWLAERIEMTEGEIKDVEGNVVGTHSGANAFTVGQRKGLRIGTPAPDGKPRFVLEIRPRTNEVVVGPQAMLAVDELRGIRPSWAGAPVPEAAPLLRPGAAAGAASAPFPVLAQVRAHGDPVPARAHLELVEGDGGPLPELVVRLEEPMRGVAPGQSVVLYQGTRVLGQATVDRAHSLARPDVPGGAGRPDPAR